MAGYQVTYNPKTGDTTITADYGGRKIRINGEEITGIEIKGLHVIGKTKNISTTIHKLPSEDYEHVQEGKRFDAVTIILKKKDVPSK